MSMKKIWDALAITCADQESAYAFQRELELRQKKNLIHPDTLILCVVDPKANIGSGGATINAILHVAEHISALQDYTVVSSDVLQDKRILVIHMGTSTPYSSCSPGFLPMPAYVDNIGHPGLNYSGLATQFDVMLQMTINILAQDSPSGFWVCSCDRLIIVPPEIRVDWSSGSTVYLFSVPIDVSIAASQHGVIKVDDNNIIEDIIYKGSKESLEKSNCVKDSKVPAVCGLVFFTTQVADTLLNLCVVPPLDTCTYLAIDGGHRPTTRPIVSDVKEIYRNETDIVLSLFFDILLCMATNIKEDDFVHGQRSGVYGTVHFPDLDRLDTSLRKLVRKVLWESLHHIPMKAEILHNSEFHYLSHDADIIHKLLLNCPYKEGLRTTFTSINFRKRTSSFSLNKLADKEQVVAVVNTTVTGATIGQDCVLLHSCIEADVNIGNNSFIININSSDFECLPSNTNLPDDIVLESLYLRMDKDSSAFNRILFIIGMHDKLQKSISVPDSTVFNAPWETFFERTHILPSEIWSPDIPASKRCFLNARLFPVYHPKEKITLLHLLWLQGSITHVSYAAFWRSTWRLSLLDILDLSNPLEEFNWRSKLYYEIGRKRVEKALHQKQDMHFLPFFRTCVLYGYFEEILSVLDRVAETTTDPAVISRTFACIADVLGTKANNLGRLRSGPADNHAWRKGLDMIRHDKIKEAVQTLATERKNWVSRPDLLVRAARHYEAAFQIQVRKAVETASLFIKLRKKDPVPLNTWVTAEAPGRMDLAGGWTDTPPLCYEKGGLVLSIAISVDCKKPIGCRVERISELKIILLLGKDSPIKLECFEFEDVMSYTQPNSTGALLKAALFCSKILPLKCSQPLSEYLKSTHGSGFVLQTWSNLPHGSGLGTSSILAGTVISALWTAAGMEHDIDSVLHAVLILEQMLTTGGGWQDQVGGLCPGITIGSSRNKLPLKVETRQINAPEGFVEKFQKHLLVVFTGKTRLARNMLQDVLRNWNARSSEIVETASQLLVNAQNSIEAMEKGDLKGLGECLNECWRHKKIMAHGCEPLVCRAIMDQLRPFVYGQSLAGAGGGGFMYIITKEENAIEKIKKELERVELTYGKATVHSVNIDPEGLVVKVDTQINSEEF